MPHRKRTPTGGTVGASAASAAVKYAVTRKYSTACLPVQVVSPQLALPPANLSGLVDAAQLLAEADTACTMVRTCGAVALRLLQAYIPDSGGRP